MQGFYKAFMHSFSQQVLLMPTICQALAITGKKIRHDLCLQGAYISEGRNKKKSEAKITYLAEEFNRGQGESKQTNCVGGNYR